MKLDKLYIGLLFTSASFMVGCSEYEDTETTSPQADANAIGANFAKEMQDIVVTPDAETFDITMNRVNPTGEKVINVKNVRIDNNFCNPATQFKFEDGKMNAKNVVNYDISKCTFQKPDTLVMKIDADAKDHIYGDGYLQTTISFVVDYTWKDSIKTTAKDNYISSDAFPVTVQVATDYDKNKKKSTTFVRLPDYFKNAGKTTTEGAAHIQFVVNKEDRLNPTLIWDLSGDDKDFGDLKFNDNKIETGMSHIVKGGGDKEDKIYDVYMRDLSISGVASTASTTASEDSDEDEETVDVNYTLTYELFYKDDNGAEHTIAPVSQADAREGTTPAKHTSKFTIKFPKEKDTPATTE